MRTADPDSPARGRSEARRRRFAGSRFGEDDRAVEPNRERKSIGCEETYARDLSDIEPIRREVEALARHAAEILVRRSSSRGP